MSAEGLHKRSASTGCCAYVLGDADKCNRLATIKRTRFTEYCKVIRVCGCKCLKRINAGPEDAQYRRFDRAPLCLLDEDHAENDFEWSVIAMHRPPMWFMREVFSQRIVERCKPTCWIQMHVCPQTLLRLGIVR